MIDAQWGAVRRVLAIRLDNLGDVLVTTPAIHAIKASIPEVEITLLASAVGAQVGQLNPDIAETIVFEAPWVDPWQKLSQNIAREQAMIARIRERCFDAAVIFTSFRQSPLPAAYLCYLANIPLRLAASIDGPGSLLTTRHKHPNRQMHEVERGLDLVGAVGCSTGELDLVLRVPGEQAIRAARWLEDLRNTQGRLGPLVIVHPGCSMPARTYPWEHFAAVTELLVDRLHAIVVLTGADAERPLVERIVDRLQRSTRRSVHPMAGELAFPGLCALIERADVMITNNTGPMHIAAAVKTPVVALFALTNPPEQWGPWRVPHRLLFHDVPCRLCYSRVCPYNQECLRLVTPRQVVDAAAELLEERQLVAAIGASPRVATGAQP